LLFQDREAGEGGKCVADSELDLSCPKSGCSLLEGIKSLKINQCDLMLLFVYPILLKYLYLRSFLLKHLNVWSTLLSLKPPRTASFSFSRWENSTSKLNWIYWMQA